MFKIPLKETNPLPVPLLKEKIGRWTMKKKAILLRHVEGRDKKFVKLVIDHYNISLEELVGWRKAYYKHGGILSLRASKRPLNIPTVAMLWLVCSPALGDSITMNNNKMEDNCEIEVNNKCFHIPPELQGHDISVTQEGIFVDGKPFNEFDKDKLITLNVSVNGPVGSISNARKVEVNGTVNSVHSISGDVRVSKSVLGNIQTVSGSVIVNGMVAGSTKTVSGDIKCMGSSKE